jgi:hypothetical protein
VDFVSCGEECCFESISYVLAFLLCAMILAKVRSRAIRQATSDRKLCALSDVGSLVRRRSVCLHGDELSRRKMASPHAFWRNSVHRNFSESCAAEYLQVPAGSRGQRLPFSSLQRFAHLALPLGISFWTFQAMSYLFDVYQGEDIDPSFVEFALYMVFFPVTDLRTHLPHARDASAIPFRERHALGRHRTRVPAHRHRRA